MKRRIIIFSLNVPDLKINEVKTSTTTNNSIGRYNTSTSKSSQ